MNTFDPVPETLVATRLALHRLATYVIAPVRHQATDRFGLRATEGGFGTPVFNNRRIWVQGTDLIDEVGGDERRTSITSLAAAATFLNSAVDAETAAEHDSPAVGDVNEDLGVDLAASDWLGRWFNVAFDALTHLRAEDASVDGSEPQLWPGHFDPAIEAGDENHRASYGASPGDAAIPEPYIYVSVWWADRLELDRTDPAWNATPFFGSQLLVSDYPDDADPVDVARGFWAESRDRLARG